MGRDLCEYMTVQAEEIRKVLKNFEKEQFAILYNDRHEMEHVLQERSALLEGIHTLSETIGREMEILGISTLDNRINSQLFQLNCEIGGLMGEIGRWNKRNKALLQMRVSTDR